MYPDIAAPVSSEVTSNGCDWLIGMPVHAGSLALAVTDSGVPVIPANVAVLLEPPGMQKKAGGGVGFVIIMPVANAWLVSVNESSSPTLTSVPSEESNCGNRSGMVTAPATCVSERESE